MDAKEFIKKNEEVYPTSWDEQKGYIVTLAYPNLHGAGSWTEGINFSVLDDETIAYQKDGSHRDTEEWEISKKEEFFEIIKQDIVNQLSQAVEELGGNIIPEGYVIFRFNEKVSDDNYESITLPQAIAVEDEIRESFCHLDKAQIGHPLEDNEEDSYFIHFEIY